ncbi:MAG TPA: methionine--tRNA ligase [Bryobacteraceae bacterium]|nr:methionine--tRNA ligase [Bryobacteraceae bacterium]
MKYYLTTPIYYVNAAPHIGHTYTTIAADTIARLKTMQGYDAYVTTGTDEHGQKIERAATAVGKTPQEFTDLISNEFREQWKALELRIDFFRRTTSPEHARVVQDLFRRCYENGYIYKGSYTGQYCVFDELYVSDAKPGDPCPDCGRPTETVTEENYFFKLSAFQDRLIDLLSDEEFLQPETRRNEVLSFVRGGLSDLSISRTTIKWGIPLPVEGNHVFYVWFDALATYMSAVEGEDLWPADLHLIGKEIVRFHAIYWPAFLWAAGLPLPKRIFAHGWLLFENDKMSKSRGNIVRATPIQQVMGADALRYFLLREVVFGKDGSFSYDALVQRYNADLANGLGNLASRTLNMISQYREGYIPRPPERPQGVVNPFYSLEEALAASEPRPADEPFAANTTIREAIAAFDRFEFSRGLETIWGLISQVDKYIVERAPWKLAKSNAEGAQDALDEVLYTAAEALRIVTALAYPVIPKSAIRIWRQLGMPGTPEDVRLAELRWGQLEPGQSIGEIEPVFPRIEAKPAIERMLDLELEERKRQNALVGKAEEGAAPEPPAKPAAAAASSPTHDTARASAGDEEGMLTISVESGRAALQPPQSEIAPIAPEITIDDFSKIDLRVGEVRSAEPVKGADKLLHLKVDIGEPEPRTIVAGIAKAYKPEELVGRKVVIVANLAPRKLKGLESRGMIVAASLEGDPPVLAGFHEPIQPGARLK